MVISASRISFQRPRRPSERRCVSLMKSSRKPIAPQPSVTNNTVSAGTLYFDTRRNAIVATTRNSRPPIVGVARSDDLAEDAQRIVDVRDRAARHAAVEIAARERADGQDLVDAELGGGTTDFRVVRGSGPPELGHLPEDRNATSAFGALSEIGERRAHRNGVRVVRV